MGRTLPSFPEVIWDGSTANREGVNPDIDPNSEDWDRIRDELIATQSFVQAATYFGVAAGTIHNHRCIRVDVDGIRHADASDGVVHGFSLSPGSPGDTIEYIIGGRTTLSLPSGQYFLRSDGQISLTPPTNGYVVKIGYATVAFDFRIFDSVRL